MANTGVVVTATFEDSRVGVAVARGETGVSWGSRPGLGDGDGPKRGDVPAGVSRDDGVAEGKDGDTGDVLVARSVGTLSEGVGADDSGASAACTTQPTTTNSAIDAIERKICRTRVLESGGIDSPLLQTNVQRADTESKGDFARLLWVIARGDLPESRRVGKAMVR